MSFHERLKATMAARKRSGAWLAHASGINIRWIRRLLAGTKRGPSPNTVQAIATALDCSKSWLLFGEGEAPQ